MIKRLARLLISFVICFVALLSPYRLRIALSEIIGWTINFFYKIYIGIIKLIVKETS